MTAVHFQSAIVPPGWLAIRRITEEGAPAFLLFMPHGDYERDWQLIYGKADPSGVYPSDERLVAYGAVVCLEHQLRFCAPEDRGIIEERLVAARKLRGF